MAVRRVSMVTIFLLLFIFLRPGETRKRDNSYKGSCQVCKDFVKSFDEGLKNTEKNSFAGGDTSWEEENQKVYSKSEVRLIEIMEGICSGNDYQCSRFVEKYEEDIERWWLKLKENGHPDLRQWLCYNHANVCCPVGTYGPLCTDCPGGKDDPCGGHGTCKGAEDKEDRPGAGTCDCKNGYQGDLCELCKDGYYMDENKNCRKCNRACLKTCSGPGAGNCTECAKGYKREESEEGEGERRECEDIDECEEGTAGCQDGTYCTNKAGSFDCLGCHSACKLTCTGSGPDTCTECADGYQDESGTCKDINECDEGGIANCREGTFCSNEPGSYTCRECNEVCEGGCTKGGPEGCILCKDGYLMENGRCQDIDECRVSSPCDPQSENCINEDGSFKCKCKAGFTRHQGKCTDWEEAERLRNYQQQKDGKKKKRKTKTDEVITSTSPEAAETSSVEAQPTNTPTDNSINSDKDNSVIMTSSEIITSEMVSSSGTTSSSVQPSFTPPSTTTADQSQHEEL